MNSMRRVIPFFLTILILHITMGEISGNKPVTANQHSCRERIIVGYPHSQIVTECEVCRYIGFRQRRCEWSVTDVRTLGHHDPTLTPTPTLLSPVQPTPTLTVTSTPIATSTLTPTPTPEVARVDVSHVAVVVPEVLNVRAGPGTNYPVITRARKGETYPIIMADSPGWRQILLPPPLETGWVLEYFVTLVTVDQLSITDIAAELPPTPTPVPAHAIHVAIVIPEMLNVRAGPGTNYPVIVRARSGETFPIIETNSPGWRQIRLPAPLEAGWVSNRFITVETIEEKDKVVHPNEGTGVPYPDDNGSSTVIIDFEQWGQWTRGDEPWGNFTQTRSRVFSGEFAGKLEYAFPADIASNYVVFLTEVELPNTTVSLQMKVYGDGSSNFVNAWIQDNSGGIWQFTFGQVEHIGWKTMEASFDVDAGWPNQPITGYGGIIEKPLRLVALVVDGHTMSESSGRIYFDDIAAVVP